MFDDDVYLEEALYPWVNDDPCEDLTGYSDDFDPCEEETAEEWQAEEEAINRAIAEADAADLSHL